MNSQALLPIYLSTESTRISHQVLTVLGGAILMGLLAQVSIPLPWTPIPITGQTFGVMLVSFLWGGRLSLFTLATYLGAGAFGVPWFANAQSGLIIGPSSGYLLGMLVAGCLMGLLSDYGWGRTWIKALVAGFIGELVIFLFGLVILSFFIPSRHLLEAGLYPFLPGAFIKLFLATSISVSMHRHR